MTYDNTWDTDSPTRTVGITFGKGFNEGRTQLMFSAQWSDTNPLLTGDRRQFIDRGIAAIQKNRPQFLFNSTTPFLGALPNILGIDANFQSTNLTFKDGTALGSSTTYIPAGTLLSTSAATLKSGLLSNAGKWDFDLPAIYAPNTGLLAPLAVSPTVKSFLASLRQELWSSLEVTLDYNHNENRSVQNGIPQGIANFQGHFLSVDAPSNPFNTDIIVPCPSPW